MSEPDATGEPDFDFDAVEPPSVYEGTPFDETATVPRSSEAPKSDTEEVLLSSFNSVVYFKADF